MKHKLYKTVSAVRKRLSDESGAISITFVIACMAAMILFMTVFEEYQSQMVIRHIEAAADLAAVEALRKNIDETALRNEALSIDSNGDGRETYEDMDKIRNDFLRRIRESLPDSSRIIRVEIPTISGGNVVIPSNYQSATFMNSLSAEDGGNLFYEGVTTNDGKRVEYWLNGVSTDTAAMSVVLDNTGLMTSDSESKDRTSYFLTAKVLVIYKRYGLLSSARTMILNYVDILAGTKGQSIKVNTVQLDRNTAAVTLQAIGKVTLR